jgi:Asp-tRNA(Asn)/Glu-tRNA(Gln) amidotransferase A subunit family amidase
MTSLPLHYLRHGLLLICLCLGTSACTRVDLAYRNLDVLIPWSLNDYLDMNRDQKSWFDDRLREHLSWHCSTQLASNLEWLDRVEQMVATQQVTPATLGERTREAKEAIAEIATRVTPSAVELLQGLDDNQVRAMQQAFDEDVAKRRKEYVNVPLAEQIDDRAKRMQKRLEPWFGKLNSAQQQRIRSWSQSLGEQNKDWIDNREHWQAQFIRALDERRSAQFPQRIAQLLQRRETLWTPQYQAAYARTEQAAIDLMVGLAADSTPEQRQRIQAKLTELRSDFSRLKCLKQPG